MPNCLVILNPGAEEIETLTVADILCRAGVAVTIAASADQTVAGSRGLPLSASTSLAEASQQEWDAIYLPGGFGSAEYARDTDAVQDVIEGQLNSGRIMAIICASPLALIPRGLGKGKRITCYPALRETLEPEVKAWVDQAVVWDGNLVTSQGPGTAMALGFALAAKLIDPGTAQQVASDMLVQWTPAA